MSLDKHKTILWDFDGVILDSMSVRDKGFVEIFKEFPGEQIEDLLEFHRQNGGWSRFVKIRYFFEQIRGESITDQKVREYADEFSIVMKQLLVNPKMLINDSVAFIEKNFNQYNFHIVSGSEQNELRFLSERLGVAQYFKSIHGSPTPKKKLVENLMSTNNYSCSNTILIGDSINDFEAAKENNIEFYGYNNTDLEELDQYISTFKNFNY